MEGRFPKLDEEWMRLAKEVLAGKLIDTVYFLEQKIREGKINARGDMVITIKKEELENIRKDLKLERL